MRTLWVDKDVQRLPWWHPLRGGAFALSCLNIFWFWKILKWPLAGSLLIKNGCMLAPPHEYAHNIGDRRNSHYESIAF